MSVTFLFREAGIAAALRTQRAGATSGTLESGYCRRVTAMRKFGKHGGSKKREASGMPLFASRPEIFKFGRMV
jgi:hypothetical protein